MPVARPFSTNGVHNGLPSCLPKVNVLDRGDGSPYSYWTTASGYNKDSIEEVTQELIDQSLHKIGLLYWNLYRLELDCYALNGDPKVTELIIDGEIDQSGTAIQPDERVCAGSQTALGDQLINDVALVADLRLGDNQGFARLYKGATTDEDNFIGYGLGEAAFAAGKCIDIYVQEATYDAALSLGGYAIDETAVDRSWSYTYINMDGLHMVFVGAGGVGPDGGGGIITDFTQDPPATIVTSGATVIAKAEITSLEFWTYP